MNTLEEVISFYKTDVVNKDEIIYNNFENSSQNFNNGILLNQFTNTPGFGEVAFSWNWYLLVNEMKNNFKFLEIGVYKGRVLSLIQLLSNICNKHVEIFGITPLNTSNDKYSNYDDVDYLQTIRNSYAISNVSFDTTTIINGYSQNLETIKKASQYAEYDIIFIDGCHDYDIVCLDIQNYSKLLKTGGYLVLDDASSLIENAYGKFLGHYDVGKAVKDVLDNNANFVHLYAVGHNRVWKKLCK